MNTLQNDRFLNALARKPVDKTPVWIMRQAGRYLPEYRATRARAGSFLNLCKTPDLAAEVTLQPLQRFNLDAAILFSDILTIPDAMGLGLQFKEGEGPYFLHPVQTEQAISALDVPDLSHLQYVYETIQIVQRELAGRVPLIGFCGSPWTLAAYMIEGQGKKGFPLLIKMLAENPQLLHNLLFKLAKSVSAHLNAQIKAGVQAVMIFDTWGGMLNASDYSMFSLHYMKLIISDLIRHYNNKRIPVILFTKGGGPFLEEMIQSGCDAIGLDWETPIDEARRRIGQQVALQGNMNPACLLETSDRIRQEVASLLAAFGAHKGHVFNLGHGITPNVDPEKVKVLVDAVHELSQVYHQ